MKISRAIGVFYFGMICFGHTAEIHFDGGQNTLAPEGAHVISAIDNGENLTITYYSRNMTDSSMLMESEVTFSSTNRNIAIKYLHGELNPIEALDSIKTYDNLDITPSQNERDSRYLHFFKSAPGYKNFHSKDRKPVFVAPKKERPVFGKVALDLPKQVSDADKAKTFYKNALQFYAKFPEKDRWQIWLKKAADLDHPEALKIVKMLEDQHEEALKILTGVVNHSIDKK